ncbi:hypothetical protein [Halohasta litorea]|uniref:Uncharacterized protein n=1 Tax=Halohasta litorea TaxID=869891 RepID=A0ABD6DCI8_9EURY|nr:hypothetical protein [Halohasta litorea]
MSEDTQNLTDEIIWNAFDRIEGCVPDSAKPETEAIVRQVFALCVERTSASDPRKITTAQEIMHNCSVETPDTGRQYMHRMAGRRDGWECIPGFDVRRNQKAYDWPHGKLELLFNREAYYEGRTLPGGYTIRYKHLEDV